jgi:hypothetical protein
VVKVNDPAFSELKPIKAREKKGALSVLLSYIEDRMKENILEINFCRISMEQPLEAIRSCVYPNYRKFTLYEK